MHESLKGQHGEKRRKKQKRVSGQNNTSKSKQTNGKRVLVCAPSNVVVDHLLSVISKIFILDSRISEIICISIYIYTLNRLKVENNFTVDINMSTVDS